MKTNLKLAKLWLDRKEYGLLSKIIRDLHASVKPEDPDSDQVDNSRGTLLLEILAMEIQMYTETKNKKRLREIYDQSTQVKSAIPHPRIMGIIRECGGKMHMSERECSAFAQLAGAQCLNNCHSLLIRRMEQGSERLFRGLQEL